MPIYVYETIPQNAGEKPERFELKQSMSDDALKVHPDSGQPVRRVISGGIFIPKKATGTRAPVASTSVVDDCCPTCH